MTLHLCRDFLTLPSSSAPATSMYLVTVFLQHVLQFDVDSQVNFDINSSSFTKGRYDAVAAIPSFASINVVSGSPYSVVVSTASYVVSSSDVNRILALRSDLNPRHNSGLFRITSVSLVSNSLGIDYRSPDSPPVETASLAWRIYESESSVTSSWFSGSNSLPSGYRTKGSTSSASRIMLNAPLGYNLRLSLESVPDRSGTVPCGFTIAPGAGSVANADFDNFAGHLHGPMWFNTTSSTYRGTAVGLSPNINNFEWTTGQWRFFAAGDSAKSSAVCFTRNVSFSTGGNGWTAFGAPEDEMDPPPDNIIDRLFVIGFGNALPNLTWRSGFFNDGHAQGMTWSRYGFPMPCIMSTYSDVRNRDTHPREVSTAIDSPFLGMTELVDVELLGGTITSSLAALDSMVFQFAARRVGRMPIVRLGRSNYTQWALTPDKQWFHTLDGIFVPWAGPALSGSVTGSGNALLVATASTLAGQGLQFFEPNPPMSDPETITQDLGQDKDATRFRKTYSYFRQPVVEVGVVKAGSNPAKP